MFCDIETWTCLNINEIGCILYCGIIDRIDVVGYAEKEIWIVFCGKVSVEIPTICSVEIDARVGIEIPLAIERVAHVEIKVAELGTIF